MSDLDWAKGAETKQEDHTVQGSEEWLKWRGKGIGSSDAAVLLGWSPWKNISQLYEEKLGLWKPVFGAAQRSAMDRGKELEPRIRHWYESNIRNGVLFKDGISTHPVREFMRASFDGINKEFQNPEDGSRGRIIEIKAPNAKDHEMARLGEIPEKYLPQVAWLMMVGGVPWADYVSYGWDGTYHLVAVKSDPILQKELMLRAELFWKHVETKTPIGEWEKFERGLSTPIDLSPAIVVTTIKEEPKDIPQIADQEVEAIVAEALRLQQELDEAQARFDVRKEQLKKILGTEKQMERGEAVFGYMERKGNVDHGVIPELIGLDLEQFRKPPIRVFYFKRKK